MEEQVARPTDFLPSWLRITLGTFMLLDAVLEMRGSGLAQLRWVVPVCLGLYFFLYVPRQDGELARAQWRKP
jgi:hypothetical protein